MIDVALGRGQRSGAVRRIDNLENTADVQSEGRGEKITPDICESKLIPNAELDKTTQHHKPWLQTDIDDKALQSVMI